jgi:hypothetical protein
MYNPLPKKGFAKSNAKMSPNRNWNVTEHAIQTKVFQSKRGKAGSLKIVL